MPQPDNFLINDNFLKHTNFRIKAKDFRTNVLAA